MQGSVTQGDERGEAFGLLVCEGGAGAVGVRTAPRSRSACWSCRDGGSDDRASLGPRLLVGPST